MAQEGMEGDQPLCSALATAMGWNLVAHGSLYVENTSTLLLKGMQWEWFKTLKGPS
jgi:hypothetical protein